MDHFKDYFWYLLSSPFKMVKKAKNQWWIWFKVMGSWFDEVKDDLQRARDETTIATCSDIMLKYHGENCGPDGITQYKGESNDAFRSRIAMYDETERMGGTRDGIILAVNSLGYEDVEHIWMPIYNGDWDRWSEFIVIINEDISKPMPTSNENLIREVRDKKESTSKDNYLINYYADIWNRMICEEDTVYFMRCRFFGSRSLDGNKKLDGSKLLDGSVGNIELLPYYLMNADTVLIGSTEAEQDYLSYAFHKTKQDQEYDVLAASEFYGPEGLPVYLEMDNLFRIRQTTRWKLKAGNTYFLNIENGQDAVAVYGTRMSTVFFRSRHLDGAKKLDGTKKLTGSVGNVETRTDYLVAVDNRVMDAYELYGEHELEAEHTCEMELQSEIRLSVHYWYGRRLNGTRKLDGSRKLDTVPGRIEYIHNNVFDVYTVCQASGRIG